jgi:hypothetical protein
MTAIVFDPAQWLPSKLTWLARPMTQRPVNSFDLGPLSRAQIFLGVKSGILHHQIGEPLGYHLLVRSTGTAMILLFLLQYE